MEKVTKEVSLPDNAFRPLKDGEEYEPLMKPTQTYREVTPWYNPQIQISAESGTKRSIFRQKNKTKRSKKRLHTTLIKPEQKVNEDLCSGFIVS